MALSYARGVGTPLNLGQVGPLLGSRSWIDPPRPFLYPPYVARRGFMGRRAGDLADLVSPRPACRCAGLESMLGKEQRRKEVHSVRPRAGKRLSEGQRQGGVQEKEGDGEQRHSIPLWKSFLGVTAGLALCTSLHVGQAHALELDQPGVVTETSLATQIGVATESSLATETLLERRSNVTDDPLDSDVTLPSAGMPVQFTVDSPGGTDAPVSGEAPNPVLDISVESRKSDGSEGASGERKRRTSNGIAAAAAAVAGVSLVASGGSTAAAAGATSAAVATAGGAAAGATTGGALLAASTLPVSHAVATAATTAATLHAAEAVGATVAASVLAGGTAAASGAAAPAVMSAAVGAGAVAAGTTSAVVAAGLASAAAGSAGAASVATGATSAVAGATSAALGAASAVAGATPAVTAAVVGATSAVAGATSAVAATTSAVTSAAAATTSAVTSAAAATTSAVTSAAAGAAASTAVPSSAILATSLPAAVASKAVVASSAGAVSSTVASTIPAVVAKSGASAAATSALTSAGAVCTTPVRAVAHAATSAVLEGGAAAVTAAESVAVAHSAAVLTQSGLASAIASSAHHFVEGGVAGAVGATVVCPIDVVKTRMQGQETKKGEKPKYANPADCVVQILKEEGPGAFFLGLIPQLLGVAPEKAMKLTVNDLLMSVLESYIPGARLWTLELFAGSGGGLAQVVFTNPMEMVKIRQQMQGPADAGHAKKTALEIARELGPAGLYQGSIATLLREIPSSAIFFGCYIVLKDSFPDQPFIAGCLAAAPAAFLCTPMDVVKTRMQMERKEGEVVLGFWDTTQKIIREEGPKALFNGGLTRVLRVSPQFGITLAVYELLNHW